jgi:hypothetical protein
MLFFELKRKDKFRFKNDPEATVYTSVGVDGMYGRYVPHPGNYDIPSAWEYCKPLEEVELMKGD